MLISLLIVKLQKNAIYALRNFQMLRRTQNRRHTEWKRIIADRKGQYNFLIKTTRQFYALIIPKLFLSLTIDYFCKEEIHEEQHKYRSSGNMFYREKIKNYLVWLTTDPSDSTSNHESHTFPGISGCPSDCILPMLTHWLTHFLTQSSTSSSPASTVQTHLDTTDYTESSTIQALSSPLGAILSHLLCTAY